MPDAALDLTVGPWTLRLRGLAAPMREELAVRWGGFASAGGTDEPRIELHVDAPRPGVGLDGWSAGGGYRVEAQLERGHLVVRSYSFELSRSADGGTWWARLAAASPEPPGRALDNLARYLVARIAIEEGGVALHGAAVLHRGRAFVFAGPSRSGKSTAVDLSPGTQSLGDDFAVVVPTGVGWAVPALPFDNTELAPMAPVGTLFPLAGVWRLFPAARTELDVLAPAPSVASLMGCMAFPWAMPDLADRILEQATQLVAECTFAHLRFTRTPEFWGLIDPA